MGDFLERLGSAAFRLLTRLLAWHLRSWQEAWSSAWQGPHRDLRLLGLSIGVLVTWVLIPAAFDEIGLMRGVSYLIAVYLSFSNATFIKIARGVRNQPVPLGLVAPVSSLGA